jgi:hypothetical protein
MPLFIIAILLFCFLISPLIAGAILLFKKHPKAGGIILGLYLALIGSFVIYGHLERRSPVGHIVRWFEGEDGAHQDVNDLAEDAKKVVNPAELQQWAVNVLQAETTNYPSGEFPRGSVPPEIRNLQSGGDPFGDVEVDSADSQTPEGRTVWIVWGGGFGHWGIRVGPPSFKAGNRYDDNYYVEWKPGIYFWCQTH